MTTKPHGVNLGGCLGLLVISAVYLGRTSPDTYQGVLILLQTITISLSALGVGINLQKLLEDR
jgi:hypothetical protein